MLKTDGGRTGVLVGQIQNCVIQKEAVTGSRHSRMIGTDMVSGIPISLGFDTHVDRVKSIQTSASVGCDMSTIVPLHRFDLRFGFYKSYLVALTY